MHNLSSILTIFHFSLATIHHASTGHNPPFTGHNPPVTLHPLSSIFTIIARLRVQLLVEKFLHEVGHQLMYVRIERLLHALPVRHGHRFLVQFLPDVRQQFLAPVLAIADEVGDDTFPGIADVAAFLQPDVLVW